MAASPLRREASGWMMDHQFRIIEKRDGQEQEQASDDRARAGDRGAAPPSITRT